MARRFLYCAAALVLAAGCGESVVLSPAEQALRELQAGHYDEAIAICTDAIQTNPKDAAAYHYRGRAYHYRNQPGDLQRAVDDFTVSIRIKPDDPEPYYSRSIAYRDAGDADKSADDEETARGLDTQLKQTYAEMADMAPPGSTGEAKPENGAATETNSNSKDNGGVPSRSTGKSSAEDLLDPRRSREPLELDKPATPLPAPEAKDDTASQETLRRLLSVPQYKLPETVDNRPKTDRDPAAESPQSGKAGGSARQRASARSRAAAPRDFSDADFGAPMPRSPWAPRDPYVGGNPLPPGAAPYTGRPVQSPFGQSNPRPTGFSPDRGDGPNGNEPRQVGSPYSAPANHPPGAYHEDFNP